MGSEPPGRKPKMWRRATTLGKSAQAVYFTNEVVQFLHMLRQVGWKMLL